jgi:hypothetical protein
MRLATRACRGGYIFYENPKHAADGWRYLEAAPFDQSEGAA